MRALPAGQPAQGLAGYKAFADYSYDWLTRAVARAFTSRCWCCLTRSPPGCANSRAPVIEPNPAGAVSLIEMQPQPRTAWPGPRSELAPAIPFQDRIHTTIFNRLVATDYGAFRQVWATGVKLARQVATSDDGTETTTVVQRHSTWGPTGCWPTRTQRAGSALPRVRADRLPGSVEQDVLHLAAITQTPPHYLLGKMTNLSADAIKAAETGLVQVSRRAPHIGETWEAVMRLALRGRQRGRAEVGAEVVWRDIETRSEAQLVDALVKMATLGVPARCSGSAGARPRRKSEWQGIIAREPVQVEPTGPARLPRDPYVGGVPGAPQLPAPGGGTSPNA